MTDSSPTPLSPEEETALANIKARQAMDDPEPMVPLSEVRKLIAPFLAARSEPVPGLREALERLMKWHESIVFEGPELSTAELEAWWTRWDIEGRDALAQARVALEGADRE